MQKAIAHLRTDELTGSVALLRSVEPPVSQIWLLAAGDLLQSQSRAKHPNFGTPQLLVRCVTLRVVSVRSLNCKIA